MREGVGRVRHVEVGELWIQDAVKQKRLTVQKVLGEENPADILTKYVGKLARCTSIATPYGQYRKAVERSRHPRLPAN